MTSPPRHEWRQSAEYRAAARTGRLPKKRPGERSPRCDDAPPPALLRGIEQFNNQEYFECHETLEAIWLQERDPIRYLYQGLLMVGVGFYHWRRGRWRGAVGKLKGGRDKLQPFRPACMTVDVERLVGETSAMLARLERLGPERLPPFPPEGLPQVHRTAPAP